MLFTRSAPCVLAFALATLTVAGCDPGPTEPTDPAFRLSPPAPDPDDPHPTLERVAPGFDENGGDRKAMELRLTPPSALSIDEFDMLWAPQGPPDAPPVPVPTCDVCGSTDGCTKNEEGVDGKVCFATCSATGDRAWDLGLLAEGQCASAAQDFCMWNHLGHVAHACHGWYI